MVNGAQVNVGDKWDNTGVKKARDQGHREMEALLLQHGT